MAYTLNVNGQTHTVDVDPDTPLLWAIRDSVGLTGTKFGCGVAQCGACTVLVDGTPRRSCVLPVSAVKGRIITIEGVGGRVTDAVKAAGSPPTCRNVAIASRARSSQPWRCFEVRNPTDNDIDLAMNGNVCRCATYHRIRAAIHDAARRLRA